MAIDEKEELKEQEEEEICFEINFLDMSERLHP